MSSLVSNWPIDLDTHINELIYRGCTIKRGWHDKGGWCVTITDKDGVFLSQGATSAEAVRRVISKSLSDFIPITNTTTP